MMNALRSMCGWTAPSLARLAIERIQRCAVRRSRRSPSARQQPGPQLAVLDTPVLEELQRARIEGDVPNPPSLRRVPLENGRLRIAFGATLVDGDLRADGQLATAQVSPPQGGQLGAAGAGGRGNPEGDGCRSMRRRRDHCGDGIVRHPQSVTGAATGRRDQCRGVSRDPSPLQCLREGSAEDLELVVDAPPSYAGGSKRQDPTVFVLDLQRADGLASERSLRDESRPAGLVPSRALRPPIFVQCLPDLEQVSHGAAGARRGSIDGQPGGNSFGRPSPTSHRPADLDGPALGVSSDEDPDLPDAGGALPQVVVQPMSVAMGVRTPPWRRRWCCLPTQNCYPSRRFAITTRWIWFVPS